MQRQRKLALAMVRSVAEESQGLDKCMVHRGEEEEEYKDDWEVEEGEERAPWPQRLRV